MPPDEVTQIADQMLDLQDRRERVLAIFARWQPDQFRQAMIDIGLAFDHRMLRLARALGTAARKSLYPTA